MGKRQRTPGDSKQHKSDTTVVFWHEIGPLLGHPEEIWPKAGVTKATPIKVEKNTEVNIDVDKNQKLKTFLLRTLVLYTKSKTSQADLAQKKHFHKPAIKVCIDILRPRKMN